MRALILAAGAVLTLSACGGGADDAADENAVDTLAVNNLVVDDNSMLDANAMMNMDVNATMDGNTAATTNAIEQDLTTNDADTNLANGL